MFSALCKKLGKLSFWKNTHTLFTPCLILPWPIFHEIEFPVVFFFFLFCNNISRSLKKVLGLTEDIMYVIDSALPEWWTCFLSHFSNFVEMMNSAFKLSDSCFGESCSFSKWHHHYSQSLVSCCYLLDMGPGARDGKIFRSSCLCSKIFFFCSYFSSLGGRLKAKIKFIYCKII